MIEFRHVNVGKKLAREVADGYSFFIGRIWALLSLSLSLSLGGAAKCG